MQCRSSCAYLSLCAAASRFCLLAFFSGGSQLVCGSLTFYCEGHIMCTFARGHGNCAGAAHHAVSVISRLGSSVIGCSSRA